MRPHAQQLDSHMGKIVRIRPDGSAPPDNPFVGQPDALPEIWSLGHRNVQAAAFDPQGRLWDIEHGTRGGDELNLVEKGKNYGWPLRGVRRGVLGQPDRRRRDRTRGLRAAGLLLGSGDRAVGRAVLHRRRVPGVARQPVRRQPEGQQRLVRLIIENDRVTGEEHLLVDRGQRVRDVRQGPDGALYIVTDEGNGELWRIAPRR